MGCIGRLLLAVLLISASACTVQGKLHKYWAKFYQSRPPNEFTLVFRPPATERVKNKGWGYVLHTDIISESGQFSVGSLGGLSFYHSTDAVEVIQTVTFSKSLEGIWKGSSFSMRGLWRTTPNGDLALPEQEFAIVGGQGGLKGASGTVYFTELQTKPVYKYFVNCTIYVEDYKDLAPGTNVDFDSMYKAETELVHDSPETTDNVLKQVGGSP